MAALACTLLYSLKDARSMSAKDPRLGSRWMKNVACASIGMERTGKEPELAHWFLRHTDKSDKLCEFLHWVYGPRHGQRRN